MKKELTNNTLKKWFLQSARSFPWRDEPTPYHVWISEVMLQQTQASVVVPYFNYWMTLFPTIHALANASIDTVLKAWEGLGYYSRARHLHEAAQKIVSSFNGQIPDSNDDLSTLKGLGSYTRAAILSFAFHKKCAPVDGNVLRLLSRFFSIEEEIDAAPVRKKIETLAHSLLPETEPWIVAEALIELGATICQKEPKCSLCPLNNECIAFRHGKQHTLPQRRARPKITPLQRAVAVVTCQEKFLLLKREEKGVMQGLYEFPYLESQDVSNFENHLDLSLKYIAALPTQSHSFTRYRVKLFPHLLEARELDPRYLWVKKDDLVNYPFSSGHRRILQTL